MKTAAEDVIALEPKLTEWDTVGYQLICPVGCALADSW